jgi:ribose transport system ATP-binding protein
MNDESVNHMQRDLVLQLNNIGKSFAGTVVLKNANLNVYSGKVMGLLGENGAGKSTLMKIVVGLCQYDYGSMTYRNKKVVFNNTKESKDSGIAIIHQEPSILVDFNIAENIMLGMEVVKNGFFIDYKAMYQKVDNLLRLLNVSKKSTDIASSLNIADQKMIGIAKALVLESNIIIMDEPTDALLDNEVKQLFSVIKKLCSQGKSIIYISHKLEEIFEICDDITIMRDGNFIMESQITNTNYAEIIFNLVGRDLPESIKLKNITMGKEVLSVDTISNDYINNITFRLYQREIVGIFGLVGSGRTSLALSIYGVLRIKYGHIYVNGIKSEINSPKQALNNGIVYVSEDRKADGLILGLSILQNISISCLKKLSNVFGIINRKKESSLITHYIRTLKVKTDSMLKLVENLSGGNQQKVAIAKALICKPDILILDEPTRGVDIGAKYEIYTLLQSLKEGGLATIVISSEMKEVIDLSDRVLVMLNGSINGEVANDDINQKTIMQYAMG